MIKWFSIQFGTAVMIFSAPLYAEEKHKCLHIMSYHKGYAWNDGIEKGVEQSLKGKCELKKFFMDTKQNPSIAFATKKSLQAMKMISSYKPDIIIASDDNASKYIVTKYKDTNIPFVFNGVNWTAEDYGFPYKNVTGMVEVAPIIPMLNVIKKNLPHVKQGVYLSSNSITEHKDFKYYKKTYNERGIKLTGEFVTTMAGWISAYKKSQTADFIILNNYAGINDWNKNRAIKTTQKNSRVLTLTNYKWMMPYSMIALTKNAKEQGQWAAKIAIEVLSGTAINDIPITINREWGFYINNKLLDRAKINIDKNTKRNASSVW